MEIMERNYHLKLQEMCDCYMDTDFKKQLKGMAGSEAGDLQENSLKYLALAIMCAVTERAGKLTFTKKDDRVTVKVKGEGKISLPPPTIEQFDTIAEIIRAILHLEEDNGEMPLALGLRSGNLDLLVKVKRKPGKETLKINFSAL